MEYLADTVTIIRYFSDTGMLGKKARNILENTDKGLNTIWISIISIVEIMYLSEKNRIPINTEELKKKLDLGNNYRVVDLDLNIVNEATKIKGLELHDRLIVATAKHLNIPIITSDTIIKNSKIIEVIWK